MPNNTKDRRLTAARLTAAIDAMGRCLPFAATRFAWLHSCVDLRLFRFGAAGPGWSAGDWMIVQRVSAGPDQQPLIFVLTIREAHDEIERLMESPTREADRVFVDALELILAVAKSPPDDAAFVDPVMLGEIADPAKLRKQADAWADQELAGRLRDLTAPQRRFVIDRMRQRVASSWARPQVPHDAAEAVGNPAASS